MTEHNITIIDHEADALPQAAPSFYRPVMGKVLIHVEKRGPAFEAPSATECRSLQMQCVAVCGDVLNAINRRCVSDLVDTWTRLLSVLRLDITPIPLHMGAWRRDPWSRLSETVIAAMCYSHMDTASAKWLSADAGIRAWVRGFRDAMARELYGHEYPSDRDLIEDGPSDPERIAYLRAEIDRYTAFIAGGGK